MSARDHAEAEALRIAEAWLKQQGWRFGPADIGKRAREILDALDAREAQGGETHHERR